MHANEVPPVPAPRARRFRRVGALGLTALVLLTGCGSDTHTDREDTTTSLPASHGTASTRVVELPPSTTVAPVVYPTRAIAVRSDHDLAVHDSPDDASPAVVLPAHTSFGSPLVLLATGPTAGTGPTWYQVLIPGRPNGRTGWVHAGEVTPHEVLHEVRVDLASRSLEVWAGDRVILTTPVAIGEPENPTPTGRFSLTDKLETADPNGIYGPFALGLSARSEVLSEFGGGDGQVGIHGPNTPSSIGKSASHGCIRVPNDVVRQLSDLLALGTPVVVQ